MPGVLVFSSLAAITHRPSWAQHYLEVASRLQSGCGATGPASQARGPTCLRAAIIRLGKATRHAGLAPLPRGISPGLGEWRRRLLRVRWSPRRTRTLSGGGERALPTQLAWSRVASGITH